MERERLLGHIDMDTREWYDGVITNAARAILQEPLETQSWVICDGDVDPEWIESLNSVLDDNRLLTMPNGDRIQFDPNVNFVSPSELPPFLLPLLAAATHTHTRARTHIHTHAHTRIHV